MSKSYYWNLKKIVSRFLPDEMRQVGRVAEARLLMINRPLVLVYQMGRVGSQTIKNSLKRNGVKPVFHFHFIQPHNLKKAKRLHSSSNQEYGVAFKDTVLTERLRIMTRKVLKEDKKVQIITPIREPIGRIISLYFYYNRELFFTSDYNLDIEKVTTDFLEHTLHDSSSKWFNEEFEESLGIDVFKRDFPKRKGWMIIRKDNIDLLIFKIELVDSLIEDVLSDFLNADTLTLNRTNSNEKKEYAKYYSIFKSKVNLPDNYVKRMLHSEFATHFYSDKEIKKLEERWRA